MPDLISLSKLELLHPAIRQEAIGAYNEAVKVTPVGVHPVVVQTLRTFAESDLLYQKGRTRPGPVVTNAKAGQSYHNYGLAVDLCLQVNGKLIWEVNDNWIKMINCFKKRGWNWGGDWKGKLKDFPHVEKTMGFNWRDLLALHNSGKVDDKGYVIMIKNCA